jgi:hypothetical protein
VIAPARTGKARRRRKTVIRTLQVKRDKLFQLFSFILQIVVNIFTLPKILLSPATCKLKMARSTLISP